MHILSMSLYNSHSPKKVSLLIWYWSKVNPTENIPLKNPNVFEIEKKMIKLYYECCLYYRIKFMQGLFLVVNNSPILFQLCEVSCSHNIPFCSQRIFCSENVQKAGTENQCWILNTCSDSNCEINCDVVFYITVLLCLSITTWVFSFSFYSTVIPPNAFLMKYSVLGLESGIYGTTILFGRLCEFILGLIWSRIPCTT